MPPAGNKRPRFRSKIALRKYEPDILSPVQLRKRLEAQQITNCGVSGKAIPLNTPSDQIVITPKQETDQEPFCLLGNSNTVQEFFDLWHASIS